MSTELSNPNEWNRERIELVKRTFCKGATDDELNLFIATCKRLGLSPEARQIFAVKRWDSKEKKELMSIQTSIDGHRLVAERTEKYEGQTEAEWCGEDGAWKNIWLDSKPPKASRVGVYKKGFSQPMYSTAHWDEFAQLNKEGGLIPMWRKMPRLMLAKCAESLALRKAFPNELSGIYTSDEMGQSQAIEVEVVHNHLDEQPKEELKKLEKKASIFDSKNKACIDWLETRLNSEGIAKDEWISISDELEGKDARSIDLIIKRFKEASNIL